jgi:hypothetical protein
MKLILLSLVLIFVAFTSDLYVIDDQGNIRDKVKSEITNILLVK